MVVGVLVVFDPLGSQRPGVLPDAPLGVRDLESSESSQLFYTAHTVASRVWESRLRLLCCCLPQDDNHRAAFSSIGQLVSGFFLVRCIYEIPFYVALDHKREAVLVAVRGTLSLKDVLTDLSAECENLSVEGVSGTCYAHKGICQAARYIYKRLVNDGILSQGFNIAPEYKLVITGHSLGAGAASLLAVLLRSTHPTLECYAFSPPGGLMSKALADYSKQFVVSVVLGKDLVPRLSIPNMEDLKRRLLKMVSNCSKPKYKILMHGCWYELFGGTPDDFPTELENRREEALSQPLLGEESLLVQRSNTYQSLSSDDSPSHPTHLPLYPPGRILHITEDGPARRHCFSQVRYRAEWSSETSFRNVLISPRMIADHMPDVVLHALRSLTREQPFALCPSSMSNSHLNVI
uniref:sn-1-specific diacylglycerol lipase n=1 Tax=Sinocyclocheilus grahami TaxID=75366 RepID=A0A672M133_SINGR